MNLFYPIADLCPKSNDTGSIPLSKKSHVEDFDEPFPELFRALTEEPDEHQRWISFTYPISLPNRILTPQQENNFKYYMRKIHFFQTYIFI